ncbi:hypothetical protein TPHA_0C03520 [Tetrapisispora phaffii CBS 4417]|uniref:RRM domain-containing protein n=1 Tax=Tetrapisispora phaffii (strain ATCC 24235 / CBS 4417 / NBRC 1672 / NRRL Y-8282 / UCD 70-5) TaxID=1071381 RepID=G8BQJ2_TETPH|nr:hypothetical protein TPHA_0C03520 [Tetrapisispora phaffii CBS 4417]CCE62504.1 hypothetical protein TPHA_0C03520 [Tetrapisispora phaffii CBS 4417]
MSEQEHIVEDTVPAEELASSSPASPESIETPVAAESQENQEDENQDRQKDQESVGTAAEDDSDVVPANAINGGRETSDKILYVGNLDKSINEETLKQYFQIGGPISNVKVINDKNNSVNYAFVEYLQHHDADVAFKNLNGKTIETKVLKINWAFQSQQTTSDESLFNLFVGDLNVDVDDETLGHAFSEFPSFVQAHVMWDMQTGRSRGYGFISFSNQEDAQTAMDKMQSTELNGRQIRINWASKRENATNGNGNNNNRNMNNRRNNNNSNSNGPRGGFRSYNNNMPPLPMGNMPMSAPPAGPAVLPPVNPQAVDDMIRRAPLRVTTVYIGNIPHFATEADLIPLLQNFGFILDFKYYPEKGNCFIKYDTHEQAAVCIVVLANYPFQGRNLKTGWGKEKAVFIPMGQQQGMMMSGMPPPPPQQQQQFQQDASTPIPNEQQQQQ